MATHSSPTKPSVQPGPSLFKPKYSLRDCLYISTTSLTNYIGWAMTVIGMFWLEMEITSGSSIGWVCVVVTPIFSTLILLMALSGNLHPGEYRNILCHMVLFFTTLQAIFTDKTAVSISSFAALNRSSWYLTIYTTGAIVQMITQVTWIMYLSCDVNSSIVKYFEHFDSSAVAQDRNVKRRTIASMWSVPNLNAQHQQQQNGKPSFLNSGVPTLASTVKGTTRRPISSYAPSSMGGGTELTLQFNYRAKALYPYKADPTDPNEFSFEQGDMFDIANPHGNKWWHALKADGTIGIVPSNYFQLFDG